MKSFDVELSLDDLKEKVEKICLEIKPEWISKSDTITIKHLNGGITNKLIACHLKEKSWNTNDSILFRIYGDDTEKFISRTDEINVMILMKKIGLGPDIYGKFNNGICYELLAGEILTTTDVYNENIYKKVAESLARMHLSKFEGFVKAKSADANNYFLCPKMDQMYNLLNEDYKANMPEMTNDLFKLVPSKTKIKEEMNFLKKYLVDYAEKNQSPIVFSHNDLLFGNIIYNSELDTINFIDYEYGAMNYQAYDIANHFNEYAGVDTVDYSNFPNKQSQLVWLKIYLEAFYKQVNEFHSNNSPSVEKVNVTEELIEKLYEEVNRFTAASDLYWATWALVQAQSSTIDFNFVNYAKIRFEHYYLNKKNCV